MSAEDSIAGGRLMTFSVGRVRYAVPLAAVFGVQDPVAGAGGAVAYQGRDFPALDARRLGWAGGGVAVETGPGAALIVAGPGGAVALIVDRVDGIAAGSAVAPLPRLVAPFVRGALCGVAQVAGIERLVVDAAALVSQAGAAAGRDRGRPGEA